MTTSGALHNIEYCNSTTSSPELLSQYIFPEMKWQISPWHELSYWQYEQMDPEKCGKQAQSVQSIVDKNKYRYIFPNFCTQISHPLVFSVGISLVSATTEWGFKPQGKDDHAIPLHITTEQGILWIPDSVWLAVFQPAQTTNFHYLADTQSFLFSPSTPKFIKYILPTS